MAEPALAANTHWLPIIYSQEWGFHYDAIFNYFLFLLITGKSLIRGLDGFFDFLRKLVNKIQIPALGIDFSHYYWDDAIIEYLRSFAKTQVAAKQSEAKAIKLDYDHKIAAATDREEALKLHSECREKLEELTKLSVDEIQIFDPTLWNSVLTRCKSEQEAKHLVAAHLKAEVVERKNGTDETVSLTKAVKEKPPGSNGNGGE